MTKSTPSGIESTATKVESFVNTVADALSHTDAPESVVSDVRESGEQLVGAVDQLEGELSDAREKSARELAEVRSRVTAVEESAESGRESPDGVEEPDSPGSNPSPQTGETGLQEPECALEEIIRLPETVATESLTANEARARSVARDIDSYAEHNHRYSNYSLTPSRLRTILTAQSDGSSAHHQTVKRVRQFLKRLGESEVSVVEDTGGTKRIVFSESLVERIQSWRENHTDVQADRSRGGLKA